jgi:high-affinity nickel-transport protein
MPGTDHTPDAAATQPRDSFWNKFQAPSARAQPEQSQPDRHDRESWRGSDVDLRASFWNKPLTHFGRIEPFGARRRMATMTRWTTCLTRPEWLRLSGFAGAVLLLHVLGWGLFLVYARRSPALAGLGTLAYTFGLRHAFDADHIAAIDNTTRKFLQDGRRSLGVGFFFSLGHSTIVFALTAGLAAATGTVSSGIPAFQRYGGTIGTSVSGTFLLLIGLLNLLVLLDVLGVARHMKRGRYDAARLEDALMNQGLMSRVFLRRLGDRIDASWKMYPLGALFGLGFDTASEIGLLAIAAGVATHHVPFLAVISLPLIFAAGMSLMDTADGAFMSHAYGWAFSNPIRKVYYNITVTSLSVLVALVIGSIELLQVTATRLTLHGGFWTALETLDFGRIGYVVVVLFVVTWMISAAIWKTRRIEQRWGALLEPVKRG